MKVRTKIISKTKISLLAEDKFFKILSCNAEHRSLLHAK
jgi:hypothetical protein